MKVSIAKYEDGVRTVASVEELIPVFQKLPSELGLSRIVGLLTGNPVGMCGKLGCVVVAGTACADLPS